MTRIIALALCSVGLAAAQIAPPLIGHMRDRAGQVRPVYGVAGTFTLGLPVSEGALEGSFAAGRGFIRTENGWFEWIPGSHVKLQNEPSNILETKDDTWIRTQEGTQNEPSCRRAGAPPNAPVEPCPARPLTLDDFTLRLTLPEPVTSFERMATEWFVLRGERGLYAVRWRKDAEPEYWQLPEAESEAEQ